MATKKQTGRCSFCNREPKDAGKLIEGPPPNVAKICAGCAEQVLESVARKSPPVKAKSRDYPMPIPKLFCDHLNRFVCGQQSAKRKLSVGVTNHVKRLIDQGLRENNQILVTHPDVANTVIEKSNILLVGPTGTGKTLMARHLAEYMDVPFAISDATTLTEAGYVGEDVENLLLKLLHAADFDMDRAEKGIIYIDEIDKIRRTGNNVSITRDVSGEGVQQSLLKMIEGTIANIPPQGGRKHPEQQYIQLDTTNILFICGGAFVGIEDIISRRLGKSAIGFGREAGSNSSPNSLTALLREIEPHDLEQYGLIPELVGRLPVIATLDELSVQDLAQVFTEPENALLKQYRKLCLMESVDLEFTPEAVNLIATRAKNKGTGARALRAVVEEIMNEFMFALPTYKKGKFMITPDVINGLENPSLERAGEAA